MRTNQNEKKNFVIECLNNGHNRFLSERHLTHPAKILLQRLMFLRCHAVICCLSDGRRSISNVWTSVCKLILGSIPAVGVVHCDAGRSHSLCVSVKYIKIIYDYKCHSHCHEFSHQYSGGDNYR